VYVSNGPIVYWDSHVGNSPQRKRARAN